MAVGYWRTPTESLYIKRTDSSQNQRLEGLPFGTRAEWLFAMFSPPTANTRLRFGNLGVGTYIPGEQFELSVDGERVHQWLYTGMGWPEE